jgi:hypothetical protein
MIMEYLKRRLEVDIGEPRRRIIGTESMERYIVDQSEWKSPDDFPDHLKERVRQSTRRLVGIPQLSGEEWQVIAFENNGNETEGKSHWIQRKFAPDRGPIFLSLIKKVEENVKELEPGPSKQAPSEFKIHGCEFKDVPEWKGRYFVDQAGSVRPIVDFWRQRNIDIVELRHAPMDRSEPFRGRPSVWNRLLTRERKTVEAIMAQRVRDYNL